MSEARLNSECISCILKKYLKAYPEKTNEKQKLEYMKKILAIILNADESVSAPEIVGEITQVKKEMFNVCDDFADIKNHFNALMLKAEKGLFEKIKNSPDPLKKALVFAMSGNYIDFGAMDTVDEAYLNDFFENSDLESADFAEYENLKSDLMNAKRLVYLTDNCGEIVADKLFISEIKRLNPELAINVIVRGENVLNDASYEDAQEVGLTEITDVEGNGTPYAGTCLNKISQSARKLIDEADVIIAKGQGNFESLRFCGKNIYYVFLCKCNMFAQRFGVPRFTGMLLNDLRIKKDHRYVLECNQNTI